MLNLFRLVRGVEGVVRRELVYYGVVVLVKKGGGLERGCKYSFDFIFFIDRLDSAGVIVFRELVGTFT